MFRPIRDQQSENVPEFGLLLVQDSQYSTRHELAVGALELLAGLFSTCDEFQMSPFRD